jgi:hypothetical protein
MVLAPGQRRPEGTLRGVAATLGALAVASCTSLSGLTSDLHDASPPDAYEATDSGNAPDDASSSLDANGTANDATIYASDAGSALDVIVDTAPLRFCETQDAFFCSDFDTPGAPWLGWNPPPPGIVLSTDGGASPPNALLATSTTLPPCNYNSIGRPGPSIGKTMCVDFDMKVVAGDAGSGGRVMAVNRGSCSFEVFMEANFAVAAFTAFTTDAGLQQPRQATSAGAVAPGNWHHIKFCTQFDAPAGPTANVIVDSNPALSVTVYADPSCAGVMPTATNLGSLCAYAPSTMLFDNFVVTLP